MDSRKNIVLTGGNTGIGLETARGLFGDGHNIIFGSRN
jgi:NAD(P)-dependent dehydrogenase (short-subunit alcohol dehydrogenase family)